MQNKQTKKLIIFFLSIILVSNFVFVLPKKAEAQMIVHDPVSGAILWKDTFEKWGRWAWEHGTAVAFKSGLKTILNRFAYESALYVSSGAPGQKSMFRTEGIGEWWKVTGDKAAGDFIQSMTTEFGRTLKEEQGGTCSRMPALTKENMGRKYTCLKHSECLKSTVNQIGVCSNDYNVVCSGDNPDKICQSLGTQVGALGSSERENGPAKCLLGKSYFGPCEGIKNEIWAGVGADLQNFNVCKPPNVGTALAITVGLTGYQERKPGEVDCGYQKMRSNWTEAIKKGGFLKDLSVNFKSEKSDMGAYLRLKGEMSGFSNTQQAINRYADSQTQGFKNLESAISKRIKTPADFLKTDAMKTQADAKQSFWTYTGDIAADAVGVFTNTLAARIMKQLWEKGMVDDRPASIAQLFTGGVSGRAQAKKYLSGLNKPVIISDSSYDTLSRFQICPEEQYAAVDNCVINNSFADAIRQKLTVQEALDDGFLDKGANFGYKNYQRMEELDHDEGVALHNMKKLRQARVVPLGWELAVERAIWVYNEARDNDLGCGDKQKYCKFNLQNIVDCFEDVEKCDYNEASLLDNDGHNPFYHLVDPNWVLKAPGQKCFAKVFGATKQYGNQRAEVCVDARSCIVENDKGGCSGGYYDYCTREKNIWRFKGESCKARFESCEAFVDTETGESVYYLQDTLDFMSCDEGNAGCSWYCLDYEPLVDKWACYWDGIEYDKTEEPNIAQRIYLNKNARDCSASSEGCSEFIMLQGGVNLVRNGRLESLEALEPQESLEGWKDEGGLAGIDELGDGVKILAAGFPGASQTMNLEPETYYVVSVRVRKLVGFPEPSSAVLSIAADGLASRFSVLDDYDNDWLSVGDGGYASIVVPLSDLDEDYQTFFGVFKSNFGMSNGGVVFGGVTNSCVFDDIQIKEVSNEEMRNDLPAGKAGKGERKDDYAELARNYQDYEKDNIRTSGVYLKRAPEKYRCDDDGIFGYDNKDNCEYGNGKWNGYCRGVSETVCEENNFEWNSAENVCVVPILDNCAPMGGTMNLPAGDGCVHLDTCENFVMSCDKDDVGCSLYTDKQDSSIQIPGVVRDSDYCPTECDGYNYYRQMESSFETAKEMVPLIVNSPTTIKCSGHDGCSEFTNMEELSAGGESKEYFSKLRQCVKPSDANSNCKTYYTWVGDDKAGYEIRTYSLKADDVGAPVLTVLDADMECDADNIGKHDDKECKEFKDTDGKEYYVFFEDTVLCTENCNKYRITEIDESNEEESICLANEDDWDDELEKCFYCSRFGGTYDYGTHRCIFQGEPNLSDRCPSQYAGCREYKGNKANATRYVFDNDFESGTMDDWTEGTGGAISTEATEVGGHSLRVDTSISKNVSRIEDKCNGADEVECEEMGGKWFSSACYNVSESVCANGGFIWQDFPANFPVYKNRSYVISFWAKTAASGGSKVNVEFSNGLSFAPQSGASASKLELNTEWRPYKLGPVYFGVEPAVDEKIIITASEGGLFIDNIVLTEVEETEALVKDSWTIDPICNLPYNQAQIGCAAYSDSNANTHYLKSFTSICREDAVGCRAMIDTMNSDSPFEQVYQATCKLEEVCDNGHDDWVGSGCICKIDGEVKCNDTKNNLVLDGEFECEFDNFRVSEDSWTYLVYKKDKVCSPDDQGCTRIGKPKFGDYDYIDSFAEVIKKIDPDDFESSLCSPLYDRCGDFTHNGINVVFKDPMHDGANNVCQWTKPKDGRKEDWYQEVVDEETGVRTYNECHDPALEETEIGDDDKQVFRISTSAEDRVPWPEGGFAKICEQGAVGCAHFVDPLDDDSRYYYIQDSVKNEQTGECNDGIDFKAGCLAFADESRKSDGSLEEVLEIWADITGDKKYRNINPFAPIACVPSDCYDEDDNRIDTDRCNEKVYRGRPDCNANAILKVEQDRTCAEWMACRSSGVVEVEGKEKRVCYQVGLCNKAEPSSFSTIQLRASTQTSAL